MFMDGKMVLRGVHFMCNRVHDVIHCFLVWFGDCCETIFDTGVVDSLNYFKF